VSSSPSLVPSTTADLLPSASPSPAAIAAALEDWNREMPAASVSIDPDVLRALSRDYAPLCPAGTPAALIRPSSTDEVSTALRIAHRHRIPVVPQGARTGMSGGANALDGCLLLSLERMKRILAIDTLEQTGTVQPGVVNAEFSRAVAEQGLFYPPDPSSWEFSTLGGNAATNAGGLCCVKYGVTADFVRALEVVLADGTVIRTGRSTAKGVAGYDLTRLFTGSEGTLGVITELTLSLRPAAQAPLTAVAFFPRLGAAGAAVTSFMAGGARPSLLELMDRTSIEVVSGYRDFGFPQGTEAALIAQSDAGPQAAREDLARFAECAETQDGEVVIADDPAEGRLLLEARRSVGFATERLGAFLSEDVCVPRARLVELVEGFQGIAAEYRLTTTCCGHAGDGNMHPTLVFDPDDADEVDRAHRAFDRVMELGLGLGGTITGEHGVGVLKREWLARELGPDSLRLQHGLKALFDPTGILNPGKVLTVRQP
jgi:glycolate oxidase